MDCLNQGKNEVRDGDKEWAEELGQGQKREEEKSKGEGLKGRRREGRKEGGREGEGKRAGWK